jgi:DNA-binding NarL/FixJ family response regulator
LADHRIAIVDDHPLFRDALNQSLQSSFGSLETLEAGSMAELTELLARDQSIDLILLDLSMPGVQAFSGLLYLRAQYPQIPVAIVSAIDEPSTIRRAFDFGAAGFVPKSQPVDQIRMAVQAVLAGNIWMPPGVDLADASNSEDEELIARLNKLTPQQVRVLMMLGEGLLNKQIAFELSVSEATIKAHVSAILQKLGVDSRTQAVIAINRVGPDGLRNATGRLSTPS